MWPHLPAKEAGNWDPLGTQEEEEMALVGQLESCHTPFL